MHNHRINWADTKILRVNWAMELVMKDALRIRMTPEDTHFNLDSGYELPDCWIKLKDGASLSSIHRTLTNARAPSVRHAH